MKRRQRVDTNTPPVSLTRFDQADWPGEDVEAAFRAWSAARKAWQAAYGWPTDALAEIRERYNERRRLWGQAPIEYRDG